jgi:hypothetical protein
MKMILGFTGTENGMTHVQYHVVKDKVISIDYLVSEYHHGDCIGSDSNFHDIVCSLGLTLKLHVHPPLNQSLRAFCKCGKVYPLKEYLERDHDIVNASDILIATPGEYEEITRSGTWTTVRYARKKGIEILIVYPDGNITIENPRNLINYEKVI